MKRFTLIAAGIASMAVVSAQRPANGGQTLFTAPVGTLTAEKVDTNMLPGSITSGNCNNLYLIPAVTTSGNDSIPGFVFGVNGWLDKEKGYMFNGNGTVPGLGVSTAAKFKLDTNSAGGFYRAHIYNSLKQLVASSDTVFYANIDTVPGLFGPFPITTFSFPTPVAVNGDFYVMVDAFSFSDTTSGIGILSNGYACGDDRSYENILSSSGQQLVKVSSYWLQPTNPSASLKADPLIAVQIQNFLGETEYLTPSSLMAYPNPANESTIFSFNSNADGTAQIEIRNLAGQLVSATSADVMNGRNEVSISLTNLANGVYSYHVTVGGETKTGKLVVNH